MGLLKLTSLPHSPITLCSFRIFVISATPPLHSGELTMVKTEFLTSPAPGLSLHQPIHNSKIHSPAFPVSLRITTTCYAFQNSSKVTLTPSCSAVSIPFSCQPVPIWAPPSHSSAFCSLIVIWVISHLQIYPSNSEGNCLPPVPAPSNSASLLYVQGDLCWSPTS